MTDRELLEMAARAAGIPLEWGRLVWGNRDDPCSSEGFFELTLDKKNYARGNRTAFWNPLTDDGDALRLAVKLGMSIHIDTDDQVVRVNNYQGNNYESSVDTVQPFNDDPYAATRRAIVRAAAEIGKGMKS